MRVILIQEVSQLGRAGDQVDVARGYARNYLIPRKLAVEATAAHVRSLEQLKAQARLREARLKAEAAALGERLRNLTVVITRSAGEQERLFGSVTASDIAEALAAQGIPLDRRKIALDSPLKALGTYAVPVRLHREVVAEVQVHVVGATR
jgi:large subunit ribosomal protein L9